MKVGLIQIFIQSAFIDQRVTCDRNAKRFKRLCAMTRQVFGLNRGNEEVVIALLFIPQTRFKRF